MEEMKFCAKCPPEKAWQPVSNFYRSPTSKSGLKTSCKECDKAAWRERSAKKRAEDRLKKAELNRIAWLRHKIQNAVYPNITFLMDESHFGVAGTVDFSKF